VSVTYEKNTKNNKNSQKVSVTGEKFEFLPKIDDNYYKWQIQT